MKHHRPTEFAGDMAEMDMLDSIFARNQARVNAPVIDEDNRKDSGSGIIAFVMIAATLVVLGLATVALAAPGKTARTLAIYHQLEGLKQ